MENENSRARAQYVYEREHRLRILRSPKGVQRKRAFIEAYAGLAEGIQFGRFANQEFIPEKKAIQKFRLLRRFLRPSDAVAELGPGEYFLANLVAKQVRSLALIDVIGGIREALPKNCCMYIGDGTHMPKALRNLNMIWSAHVVEHIHPKALHEHLTSVRGSLRGGGRYIIFTPNRFTGPHDISRAFSDIAQGLHLKEYTVTEMHRALLRAKFRNILCYAGGKGVYLRVPSELPLLIESLLNILPFTFARMIAGFLPCRALLGVIMVGQR